MATGSTLQALSEQSTCPLCLKYFENPVILDCGHNFCKVCITNYWGESNTAVSCPVCDQTFPQRSFRPNWQVANVTEHVKKLEEKRQAGRKRGVCEIHDEPLQIFCKDDEASICLLCDKAKEHRGHNTVPVEEAAEEYKERIKTLQLSLEKKKKNLVGQKEAEKRSTQKCLDIKNDMNRYERGQVKKEVKLVPGLEYKIRDYTLKKPFLKTAMEKCEGILKRALDQVNVALDADTAHPRLVVSTDLKSVKCESKYQELAHNPTRFDTMTCVLGCERFVSGRQLWEVKVEEEKVAAWAVGVAGESIKKKGKTSLSPNEKIWAVGKSKVTIFSPCQLSAFTSPEPIPLTLKREPAKILVSLDYEKGCVEFFDADTGDWIFTFRSISFSQEKICPYFWLEPGITLKC